LVTLDGLLNSWLTTFGLTRETDRHLNVTLGGKRFQQIMTKFWRHIYSGQKSTRRFSVACTFTLTHAWCFCITKPTFFTGSSCLKWSSSAEPMQKGCCPVHMTTNRQPQHHMPKALKVMHVSVLCISLLSTSGLRYRAVAWRGSLAKPSPVCMCTSQTCIAEEGVRPQEQCYNCASTLPSWDIVKMVHRLVTTPARHACTCMLHAISQCPGH